MPPFKVKVHFFLNLYLRTYLMYNLNLRTSEAHFAEKYVWRGTLTSYDTLVEGIKIINLKQILGTQI